MPNLIILSQKADKYQRLLQQADLPNLNIIATTKENLNAKTASQCDIVIGEPSRIREQLPALLVD